MNFENDYTELIEFAKSAIKQKRGNFDPRDIVNDAYIKFTDSSQPYDKGVIKKYIYGFLFTELDHETQIWPLLYEVKKIEDYIYDRTCTVCLQELPEAMFKVKKFSNKPDFITDKCVSCYNKIEAARSKSKLKRDPGYYKRFREFMSDSYIRNVLIKQGHLKESITEDLIKSKRIQIFNKRQKRQLSLTNTTTAESATTKLSACLNFSSMMVKARMRNNHNAVRIDRSEQDDIIRITGLVMGIKRLDKIIKTKTS